MQGKVYCMENEIFALNDASQLDDSPYIISYLTFTVDQKQKVLLQLKDI